MEKVVRTEAEWREQLAPEEYKVLRQAGTEAPWTGEYTDTKTVGVYRCRACGAELFRSGEKFESHCGWPSFYQPTSDDAVTLIEDRTLGMKRTEVRCAAVTHTLAMCSKVRGTTSPPTSAGASTRYRSPWSRPTLSERKRAVGRGQ